MRTDDLKPTFKERDLKFVLCLYGGADTGKSETLIALARALQDSARYYYEQKGQHGSKDRRVVIKFRGWIIGIGTYGDTEEVIDRNFEFFKDQHCDIGITAARVEGATDIKSYVQGKCKQNKVDVCYLEKQNAKTPFTRKMVKVDCVDQIICSLKKNGIKEIKASLKSI